jgi:hypothetical protein
MINRFKIILIGMMVFISIIFNGCELDTDMRWQSFTSWGDTLSFGFDSWRYEHNFYNFTSDKVVVQWENGKDEHGFSQYQESVIAQNDMIRLVATYYDFFDATSRLDCSVGTYDGRELEIEVSTGRTIFKDK